MAKLSPRHFRLVFSFVMGAIMVFIMTFVITLLNIGPVPDFLARRATAFFLAYAVAVPVIYFAALFARRITARLVQMP